MKELYQEGGVSEVAAGIRRFGRYRTLNINRRVINKQMETTIQETSKIQNEDWDNLILLDACRYDLFKKHNTLDGELTHRISKASATPGFLHRNFSGEECHDIVYVTANPMYRTEGLGDIFYKTIDVWESCWDTQLNTVHPADVKKP